MEQRQLGTGGPMLSMLVPNRLFKNVAGKRFAEITASSRTGHLQKGHGVAIGDWDRDGAADIFHQMGGAIQGDRRKLSYVTSLVLIVAVPMIILMPWIVRLSGIPDVVAGAWMGGTLDTTGSVTAAGALVSETTMKVGTIVKFSQNVLIGVAALALSMWWSVRTNASRNDF